jgi:DNA-binding XRE family transcriptional regulator
LRQELTRPWRTLECVNMTWQEERQVASSLKERRINRGLGLAEAAELIGVSRRCLYDAEKGTTPRPANALKIAEFWGERPTDLWPIDGEAA